MEKFINEMMKASAKYLEAAMKHYHPARVSANGNWNALAEANILNYLSVAAQEKGGFLYPEVPIFEESSNSQISRMDLLAYFPEESLQISVEGKRLFNADGAKSIVRDFNRLICYRINSDEGTEEFKSVKQRIALIVAITQLSQIAEDWQKAHFGGQKKAQSWKDLSKILNKPTVRRGNLKVELDYGENWHCEVLYAWQEIK